MTSEKEIKMASNLQNSMNEDEKNRTNVVEINNIEMQNKYFAIRRLVYCKQRTENSINDKIVIDSFNTQTTLLLNELQSYHNMMNLNNL